MRSTTAGRDRQRWAVILAGGDGKRLLPFTRSLTGEDCPKQFCRVDGTSTLLRQSLDRMEGLVEAERTLLVLTRSHQRYHREQLKEIPPARLLVQPQNKGTTAAILYSVIRIEAVDPRGIVAILPSDHHFENLEAFHRQMDLAFAMAQSHLGRVILLGVVAGDPEVSYGWIEPGGALHSPYSKCISRVKRFWEKPSHSEAVELMRHGCLWNSFIMVGEVGSYLSLTRRAVGELYRRFMPLRGALSTLAEERVLEQIYEGIPASNFSNDVLAARPGKLAVMRSSGLGWTDMGEPDRVLSVLERKHVRPDYGVDFAHPSYTRARAEVEEQTGDGESQAVATIA